MLTCALGARLQPPYRGGVHVVGSRHVRLRLASLKPRQGFLPLVRRELASPVIAVVALVDQSDVLHGGYRKKSRKRVGASSVYFTVC